MSDIDVVARLTLNAQQFSAEATSRLDGMRDRAASTARDIKQSFGQSLAEVKKLASQGLELPRTKAGSLDLSGEIKALKEAATGADRNAQSLRELQAAQLAAAAAGRGNAEVLQQDAKAAEVAAVQQDQLAARARARIGTLEAVQVELNKTTSMVERDAGASDQSSKADYRAVQAKQMLQHQIRAIGDSFAFGAPLSQVFAQHMGGLAEIMALYGQAAAHSTKETEGAGEAAEKGGTDVEGFTGKVAEGGEHLTKMGGKLAAVGEFLGGPWGFALITAVNVLAPFVGKLFESNDALGEAVAKLAADAEATDAAREAKAAFAVTEAGVISSIRSVTDELKQQNDALKTNAELAVEKVTRDLRLLRAGRPQQQQALADRQRELDASGVTAGVDDNPDAALASAARARQARDDAQSALDRTNKAIAEGEAALLGSQKNLAAEAAKRDTDAVAAIHYQYERAGGLIDQAKKHATAEEAVNGVLRQRLALLEREEAAAIKKAQDAQRDRSPSLGSQLDEERGARLLTSAKSYNGLSENSASGRGQLSALFKQANENVDPKMTAWCAAFVNAVLATNGLPGSGSLSARSFLGYGENTDKPSKGDIVVLKTGKTQEHVGFYAGEGANGRILVTGGNQSGGRVSTTSFARSEVEAFRRAPDAASVYKDEKQAAADLAKAAEQAAKVVGSFDPFAAMARRPTQVEDNVSRTAREMFGPISFKTDSLSGGSLERWEGALKAGHDTNEKLAQDRLNTERGIYEALGDAYSAVFEGRTRDIAAGLKREGAAALSAIVAHGAADLVQKLPDGLKSMLTGKNLKEGAGYGALGGSAFASITGGKQSAVGSEIGGALGEVAGKALGKSISAGASGLAKSLGGAAGPIGAVLGGVVGNVLGGLLAKPIKGSVSITGASTSSTSGSSKVTGQLAGDASNVQQSLSRIAQALGATVGSFDVAIGKRDDWYHVGGSSSVNVDAAHPAGLIYEGKDEAAAVKAAIANAISDGAIMGVSKASQVILQSGQDLDQALAKALSIESIPRDLMAALDPVGAALDDFNKKWKVTVDALHEGGATAEQFAQAEQLYKLQLDQVKASTASASQGLKDFLLTLKLGSDSPYSLRDQEVAAKAALQPFLDQIGAGQNVDQAKFQAASKSYLDVERGLYGSTQGYFDAQDLIQSAVNSAISTIDNAVPISTPVESPFLKAAADNTAATASNTQTQNELLSQVSDTMSDVRALLGSIADGGGQNLSTFIGADRLYLPAG